jgi:ArsR family transcriptional regulator
MPDLAERGRCSWNPVYNCTLPSAAAISGDRTLASTNFRVSGESPIPEALLVRIAERLRVLGQPVRLRLIEQLTTGASTPQELSDTIGVSQQNVSKHLLVLYRSGIVSRRPEGSNVIYSLVDESALKVLNETLGSVKRHLQELSELATRPPESR